jgi:hypothetical protein
VWPVPASIDNTELYKTGYIHIRAVFYATLHYLFHAPENLSWMFIQIRTLLKEAIHRLLGVPPWPVLSIGY